MLLEEKSESLSDDELLLLEEESESLPEEELLLLEEEYESLLDDELLLDEDEESEVTEASNNRMPLCEGAFFCIPKEKGVVSLKFIVEKVGIVINNLTHLSFHHFFFK